eukprot:scaffold52089_cov65-Phaeocystis_antarctica.AAC.1
MAWGAPQDRMRERSELGASSGHLDPVQFIFDVKSVAFDTVVRQPTHARPRSAPNTKVHRRRAASLRVGLGHSKYGISIGETPPALRGRTVRSRMSSGGSPRTSTESSDELAVAAA